MSLLDSGFEIQKREYKLGEVLGVGTTSPSGLYAICSTLKNCPVLRVTPIKEMAELLSDGDYRSIRSIWLI